jgi:hypothetical protein
MMRIRLSAVFPAALLLVLAGTSTQAGITYVSQDRRVEADTGDLLDTGPDLGGERLQVKSASGFGEFDEEVRSTYLQQPDNDFQEARASQNSVLNGSSLSANGSLYAVSADEAARHRSLFDVTFDVTGADRFALHSDLDYAFEVPSRPVEPVFTLRFSRVGSGGGETTVFDRQLTATQLIEEVDSPVAYDLDGALEDGRYRLLLDVGTTIGQGSAIGTYHLGFTTSADTSGGSGGGGTPSPVPLPPGAWTGLATLGGLGLMALVRSRSRKVAA